MKIGAFAEKFNTKKSTIRYYTELNLLIPDKSQTYPNYNASCINDMTNILELKNMGFSIEEIMQIKVHERFQIHMTADGISEVANLLNKKIDFHLESIKEHNEKIQHIETYKNTLKPKSIIKELGLPFRGLDFLMCPVCHEAYAMSKAVIKNNFIFEGDLQCQCDQKYTIHNGIINFTHDDIHTFERKSSSLETTRHLRNSHMAAIKSTGSAIKKDIKKWQHEKGILFINADVDILMMDLDKLFLDTGIYIFCSYDYPCLAELKVKLEQAHHQGNFVFIYFNKLIPVSKEIPYLIDNVGNMLDFALKKDNGYGIQQFKHIVNNKSHWLCIHLNVNRSIVAANKKIYSFLDISNYKSHLNAIGMTCIEESQIVSLEYMEGLVPEFPSMGKQNLTKMSFKTSSNLNHSTV